MKLEKWEKWFQKRVGNWLAGKNIGFFDSARNVEFKANTSLKISTGYLNKYSVSLLPRNRRARSGLFRDSFSDMFVYLDTTDYSFDVYTNYPYDIVVLNICNFVSGNED